MVYSYSVILSLLFTGNTLLSEMTHKSSNNKSNKPSALKNSPKAETQEETIDEDEQKNDLSKEDIAELELVFEHSPKKAQVIVKHLKDPNYFRYNRDHRSSYFVGEPGSGKTSMAHAIAYKMSKEGWDHKFIGSTELVGKYRNEAAVRLKKELKAVVDSKRPTIVIIDELHRLLENTESKHHDTDTAATELWLFLDRQRNNEKFFFIGTMNRVTKLPKPFKDRILTDIVNFPHINDAKVKTFLFRQLITLHEVSFDNAVTDDFLNAELAKLGPCMGRKLKKVSKLLFQMQRMDSEEQIVSNVIKKENITKAIAEYIALQKYVNYDFVEETDEERQNRYQVENINLQKQHQMENQRLQEKHHEETQRLQEQHFIQQQLIQFVSSQYRLDAVSILAAGQHLNKIESCLSDEQKKLIDNILPNWKEKTQTVVSYNNIHDTVSNIMPGKSVILCQSGINPKTGHSFK